MVEVVTTVPPRGGYPGRTSTTVYGPYSVKRVAKGVRTERGHTSRWDADAGVTRKTTLLEGVVSWRELEE